MSAELTAAVQEIAAQYPDHRSAVLPALRLAQEHHGGWLSPEAFREVAEALELTPAYCLSVASFYDMYNLEPVGEHMVEVCTNVSCALSGAQQVVEAFESELGCRAGETSAGRRGHAADDRVPGRLRLGDRRRRRPPLPAARERRGRARDRRGAEAGWVDSSSSAGADERDLTKLAEYEAIGGYTALVEGAGAGARCGDRGAEGVAAARPRRRVLRHRHEVVVRAEARCDPEAALPRRQRRRVGAGQLQGQRDPLARPAPVHRGVPDHRARGRVEGRVRLRPRRVHGPVRDPRRSAPGDRGPARHPR